MHISLLQMKVPELRKWYLLVALVFFFLTACADTSVESTQSSQQNEATPTSIPTTTQIVLPEPTATNTPQPSRTPTQGISADQRISLMAVGDMMFGRTIGELIQAEGPLAPFLYTFETLSTADIAVGNLECPISTRGTPEEKTYVFRAPPGAGEALALAGFDLVSLANNHALDYGPLALEDTMKVLDKHKILYIGAGMDEDAAYAPVFLEVDGLSLAFLAFADIPPAEYDYRSWEAGPDKPGIAWAHKQRIQDGVRAAKAQADVVIVLVHNGYEIVQKVSAIQQEIAHLAIESGASLVIGSHPHVLQRIEPYQDGIIFYSMGNFVFDNFLFPPNYSAILSVELSPNGVESYEMIDVIVQLNGVPQIMPYDLE